MAYLAATRIWDGTNTVLVNPDGSLSADVTGSVAVSSVSGGTINQITNPVTVAGTLAVSSVSAGTITQVVNPVAVTGPLTNTQLRASPVDSSISDGTHVANVHPIVVELHGDEYGVVTNAVIHGHTTAGGGGFVDVKVSPSGAMQVGGDVGVTGSVSVTSGTITRIINAVPVTGTITHIEDPVTVQGTVAISSVAAGTINQITNPVTVAGTVGVSSGTITQIVNPVTVEGAVSVGTITQILNPVSVTGAITVSSIGTITQIANPVTVEGTVAVSSVGSGTLTQIVNPVTVTGTVGVAGSVSVSSGTITQIANPVTVTGSVSVSNIGTITQIANPVTVTGNTTSSISSGTITQIVNPVAVTGNMTVNSIGTITQIANPVIVSGTVAVGTITRITDPVTVTGSLASITSITDAISVSSVSSGTITQITNPVTVADPVSIRFDAANMSAFGDLISVNPSAIMQGGFYYGLNTQAWQYNYVFTVTSPASPPAAGDIYSVTNAFFTVLYSNGVTLVASGTQNPATATGSLVRVTGTGTTPIAYSAWTTAAGVNLGTGAAVGASGGLQTITAGAVTSGNFSYVLSRKIITYRAGQGNTVRFTPTFANAATNCLQLYGVGTIINNLPYDGYFFGYESAASNPRFGCHHYRGGSVMSFTPTANWRAQTDYDTTKGSPMMIRYPYLGYGDIEFFVQASATGRWDLVHLIQYAASSAVPQLTNPAMYLMGFARNTGTASAIATVYCGSYAAFLSGERFYGGPRFATDAVFTAVSTEQHLISIRNCTSFNGVPNRGLIRINVVNFTSASNTNSILRFYINAQLGGTPAFSAVSGTLTAGQAGLTLTAANSIASRDVASTGTPTNGQYVFNIGLGSSGEATVDMTHFDLFIAPGETLTITGFGSANTNMGLSINWSEDV